jgi:hypothetical protein
MFARIDLVFAPDRYRGRGVARSLVLCVLTSVALGRREVHVPGQFLDRAGRRIQDRPWRVGICRSGGERAD